MPLASRSWQSLTDNLTGAYRDLPACRGFPAQLPPQAHGMAANLKHSLKEMTKARKDQTRLTDFEGFIPNKKLDEKKDERQVSTNMLNKFVTPRVRLVVRGTGCASARLEVVSVVRAW